jgi:hypothetical protein
MAIGLGRGLSGRLNQQLFFATYAAAEVEEEIILAVLWDGSRCDAQLGLCELGNGLGNVFGLERRDELHLPLVALTGLGLREPCGLRPHGQTVEGVEVVDGFREVAEATL